MIEQTFRTTRTTRTTRRIAGCIAAATVVTLSACGTDDNESSGRDVVEGPVAITATDYAYEGVPETVRAGASFTLTNDSTVEAHELVAIRLPDDETRPVAELVQLPPEELAGFFPSVETVLLAAPGDEAMAVVGNGTLTEPGRYALVCVIPTGADPQEYLEKAATSEGPPDVAGGPPHIAAGMFAELTVVG